MANKSNKRPYRCPFCENELQTRYAKCFNIYCGGRQFEVGNLVLYRLNPELGMARIIKELKIPTSTSLDEEDTHFTTKYKIIFPNKLIKIAHPIDLIHYVFEVNEAVLTKYGKGVINSKDIQVKQRLLAYEILFENGKLSQVDETEIYSQFTPSLEEQISEGDLDPPSQFLLKYWAQLFHSYYTSYQIKCITNSRLTLMPHQINVAHRLSEEFFPRIILADEVGLGKTIEAGIYIKEMMARNLAERVLIIVPATLVRQWHFEMQNKFNITFTIYDGKKVKEIQKKGNYKQDMIYKNPFFHDNLILCSLQFARNPKYANFLSQISWDIVVFDEAHHLRRYLVNAKTGNYRETLNYRLAKKISRNCESLLLLSATPLQLHSFELFSLLELIRPEAFHSFSDFEHFRKNLPFINLLIVNLNNLDKLNTFELENTLKLLKKMKYVPEKINNRDLIQKLGKEQYKEKILQKIEADHTLSKFLIRNRKKNVFFEEFLNKRVVKTIIVEPTKDELELYNEIRLYLAKIYNSSMNKENVGLGFVIATLQKLLTSSKYAIIKSLERRLEHIDTLKSISDDFNLLKEEDPEFFEQEYEEAYLDEDLNNLHQNSIDLLNQEKMIKDFHARLKDLSHDSKAEQLFELIRQIYDQNPQEKIILFTQFVDTLFFLKKAIESLGKDISVYTFYGGLNKEEKDIAVNKFRTDKKFAILLSTEVGGEGRNFQFCRIMVNYDLPWNPMKLEQRIGRLDRIGQESKEIYIYNFFIDHTIETDIVFALNTRINLFEESVGILEPIIGKIERDMKQIIFSESDGTKRKKLNEFYRNLDDEIKKAKEIEMQLDDMMIDKKSFQMEGLLASLASCQEVKLTHDELFLLIHHFLQLKNNHYGTMSILKDKDENIDRLFKSILTISLKNLSEFTRYNTLRKEYEGTFDLELAKEHEHYDFFALGHPLIDQILEFIRSDYFPGEFTVLEINSRDLDKLALEGKNLPESLHLFIFSVKFQGYLIENQIIAILLDENGKPYDQLKDVLLNITNYDKISKKPLTLPNISLPKDAKYRSLVSKAKTNVKTKTSLWKTQVKNLNQKVFQTEVNKKEKIYTYKKKVLTERIQKVQKELERKNSLKPTTRQLRNIQNLEDESRKREKLEDIERLKEQIFILEEDLHKIQKKRDDLAFEYQDIKKDLQKRNQAKFYTNLIAYAIIQITLN